MELVTETGRGHITVRMMGQFWDPGDIRLMQKELDSCAANGPVRIVLDMQRLTFISSIGLGFLIRIYRDLCMKKGELVLFRPSGGVLETLEIADLHRIVPIVDTTAKLERLLNTPSTGKPGASGGNPEPPSPKTFDKSSGTRAGDRKSEVG